ncbi:MAG: ABC transporter permease [Clostridia bacterium]|nr:ABC transporter permease [Clostridia bacterium]
MTDGTALAPKARPSRRPAIVRAVTVAPHGLWCLLFILAPLAFVVYYTFTDPSGAFTMANLKEVFSSAYLKILKRSVLLALESTAICLLLAYPLALAVARLKPRNQSLAILLFMLPMWINLLIRTYSLKLLLETNGPLNSFLGLFGIEPIGFLNSEFAIILGMVYNYLPYMILPIYSVIAKIDPRLKEAAQDLGCNGFQTTVRVVLPLSVSGIISGITMVFVPSISTFFISKSLSDGRIKLIGDVIEQRISLHNVAAYEIGSALSFILMILIIVSMLITNRFGDKDRGVVV